jgi:thiamine-phosphate diphosphorylase
VLLYYITDRSQFPGNENARRTALLSKIVEAARAGVHYIQLREKDLPTRELESLARDAVRVVRDTSALITAHRPRKTQLLINSRTDVALAVEADGVHLRSDDLSPKQVRELVSRSARKSTAPARFLIACSCHSPDEVRCAESVGADFAVFAPVFEKKDAPGVHPVGLQALAEACRGRIPTLALGGVTLDNTADCIQVGAAGIAAIRLFQEHPIEQVVRILGR